MREEEVRRPRSFDGYDGAALRSPHYAHDASTPAYEDESQDRAELGVGKMVKHPQFGLGEIRALEGHGENTKLTIEFDKVGTKKILVKYGNLKIL
ncbi:MAG: hypothetical protein ALAOOOJD_01465 [bacterium]|nr:hypothetical protein [bacterium]